MHWSHFVNVFTSSRTDFQIMSPNECERLKETFDITENEYVSVFEFDIFVRLFHPFRNLINNWYQITGHPAYMGFKTYDEICSILGHHTSRPGRLIAHGSRDFNTRSFISECHYSRLFSIFQLSFVRKVACLFFCFLLVSQELSIV